LVIGTAASWCSWLRSGRLVLLHELFDLVVQILNLLHHVLVFNFEFVAFFADLSEFLRSRTRPRQVLVVALEVLDLLQELVLDVLCLFPFLLELIFRSLKSLSLFLP
jgi:hypothetical protein